MYIVFCLLSLFYRVCFSSHPLHQLLLLDAVTNKNQKSSCRLHEYKRAFFGVVVCATLALLPRCFSVVHLDIKVARKTGEGFCLLPGSLVDLSELKTILMGTNTPHTCSPVLVWQKQARPFSQVELKVGELGFPIHFVCVSAALYHRGGGGGTRQPFSPQVNMAHWREKWKGKGGRKAAHKKNASCRPGMGGDATSF